MAALNRSYPSNVTPGARLPSASSEGAPLLSVKELTQLANRGRLALKPPKDVEDLERHPRMGRAFSKTGTSAGMAEYRLRLNRAGAAVLDAAIDPLARPRPVLLGQLRGAGVTDSGHLLSPAAVRRLACEASIVPVVLGGPSTVLDLGHTERYFTPAQRRAMTIRDKGCAFPGCTIPPQWCEGHHDVP